MSECKNCGTYIGNGTAEWCSRECELEDQNYDLRQRLEAAEEREHVLNYCCDKEIYGRKKAEERIAKLEDRLVISPYGDDKIDELEEAFDNCKHYLTKAEDRVAELTAALEGIKPCKEVRHESHNHSSAVGKLNCLRREKDRDEELADEVQRADCDSCRENMASNT